MNEHTRPASQFDNLGCNLLILSTKYWFFNKKWCGEVRRGEAWRGLTRLGEIDRALARLGEADFIDFPLFFNEKQRICQKDFS